MPTLEDVKNAWLSVVEEKSDVVKDFSMLAHNQRKLIRFMANHGGAELSSNSISRMVNSLIEKDYIEKVEDEFRLIIPLYKEIL